jgi:glycosyltransferase involved in cell wall biosynthesis
MKIILVHNFYQQPGGEDEVFASESKLLRENGHQVIEYLEYNRDINNMHPAVVAFNTFWSQVAKNKLSKLLNDFKPDLVHFHNTFPLISPSVYCACKEKNIPVVQSLHNPRLICPAATLCRNGRICEDCFNKIFPWPAIANKCYHSSYTHTAIVALMLAFHRWLKIRENYVDRYLVATEFYRGKFINGGIPKDKIIVKPYFTEDSGVKPDSLGSYVLFIGRLSPEKGILTLLKSWMLLKIILSKLGEMVF